MTSKPRSVQTELSFRRPGSTEPPREPEPPREEPGREDVHRPTEPDPAGTPNESPRGSRERAPVVHAVGEVVRAAHRLLDGRFGNLWIEGEVSGLKIGAAGHAYFSLKDDFAVLPTAMWRTAVESLRFRLEDGQKLRVYGRLGVFVKQGRFQFYGERAEPAGLGALMLELEQRKARLAAEGLFDPARKRPLPRFPRCIGVVTSAHGAAIHDILEVARRRSPPWILLSPANVQGPDAPWSLRRALARVAARPEVDVVILGRGGGTFEDLMAFNDEALVRAVATCPVPVVSAVGHEVDVTLCDLVADVRAATPSQAAEIVVPDRTAEIARLDALRRRMTRAFERVVLEQRGRLERQRGHLARSGGTLAAAWRARLRSLDRALERHHPRQRIARDRRRLELLRGRLGTLGRRLPAASRIRLERDRLRLERSAEALPGKMRERMAALALRLRGVARALPRAARLRLTSAAASLHALSPVAVLARGYAIVRDDAGRILTDSAAARAGQELAIRLHRGEVSAKVTATRPTAAAPDPTRHPAPHPASISRTREGDDPDA